MTITRRATPPPSAFLADLAISYYWDSFEAPLTRAELGMRDLYLAIFAHHPWWAKLLLLVRSYLVAPFGLKGTTFADLYTPQAKTGHAVGEKIGNFLLFAQNDRELIAGGNDKHLDFRVSVLKLIEGGNSKIVLSTAVTPHNFFGRAYLFVILPFHRLGVRTIMANAVAAQRL